MSPDGLQASIEKMRAEGVGDAAIDTFAHYYEQLREGASGMLPESDIEPVEDLPTLDDLPEGDPAIVDTAVVLKLNGGLGTSMGMTKAKSLIEAKDGQTFLDIVVGQVLGLRERFGARVPLVLMNSFATRDDSLEALRRHPEIESDVPLDFLQNKVPKIARRRPAAGRVGAPTRRSSGRRPATATSTPRSSPRGCSTTLLEHGYRYAFVSNSDNLGAVLDPRILSWVAHEELPVRDGGRRAHRGRPQGRPHRAAAQAGGLVLRETAQTPEEDLASLQDVGRHRYVNTNNLWVGLEALRDTLAGARRRARAADHRQPQDGRPVGPRLARRSSSSRRRWAPPSACSRAPARCTSRGGASRRSRRPTTCSRCARTPTCCSRTTASSSRPSATSRRSSTSTPTTTSSSATSSRASRPGRRRSWRASA